MEELLVENRMLINVLAKAALRKENFLPENNLLYCLQVAKWALDHGKLAVWDRVRYQLSENLNALLYLTQPADAMLYLEGEHDLMADFENLNPTAKVLAAIVLNQLHSRLSATLPGYPTS
jgi:hypothetical protein